MAQQLKGKLVGPYKPIHRNCAIYFLLYISAKIGRFFFFCEFRHKGSKHKIGRSRYKSFFSKGVTKQRLFCYTPQSSCKKYIIREKTHKNSFFLPHSIPKIFCCLLLGSLKLWVIYHPRLGLNGSVLFPSTPNLEDELHHPEKIQLTVRKHVGREAS